MWKQTHQFQVLMAVTFGYPCIWMPHMGLRQLMYLSVCITVCVHVCVCVSVCLEVLVPVMALHRSRTQPQLTVIGHTDHAHSPTQRTDTHSTLTNPSCTYISSFLRYSANFHSSPSPAYRLFLIRGKTDKICALNFWGIFVSMFSFYVSWQCGTVCIHPPRHATIDRYLLPAGPQQQTCSSACSGRVG